MFGALDCKNFKDGDYKIKLVCWESSIDNKQILLEFKNTIKRTGIIDTLDIWKKVYKDESKSHPLKIFYFKKKKSIKLKLTNFFIKYKNKILAVIKDKNKV